MRTTMMKRTVAALTALGALFAAMLILAGGSSASSVAPKPGGNVGGTQVSNSQPSPASGSGSGSGGSLAATGVAVIGIAALGVVLLVGGGMLLVAGRRRTHA